MGLFWIHRLYDQPDMIAAFSQFSDFVLEPVFRPRRATASYGQPRLATALLQCCALARVFLNRFDPILCVDLDIPMADNPHLIHLQLSFLRLGQHWSYLLFDLCGWF